MQRHRRGARTSSRTDSRLGKASSASSIALFAARGRRKAVFESLREQAAAKGLEPVRCDCSESPVPASGRWANPQRIGQRAGESSWRTASASRTAAPSRRGSDACDHSRGPHADPAGSRFCASRSPTRGPGIPKPSAGRRACSSRWSATRSTASGSSFGLAIAQRLSPTCSAARSRRADTTPREGSSFTLTLRTGDAGGPGGLNCSRADAGGRVSDLDTRLASFVVGGGVARSAGRLCAGSPRLPSDANRRAEQVALRSRRTAGCAGRRAGSRVSTPSAITLQVQVLDRAG